MDVVCQICGHQILDTETATSCPRCETPHHSDCWEFNQGCSTFGCQPAEGRPASVHIGEVEVVPREARPATVRTREVETLPREARPRALVRRDREFFSLTRWRQAAHSVQLYVHGTLVTLLCVSTFLTNDPVMLPYATLGLLGGLGLWMSFCMFILDPDERAKLSARERERRRR